MKKILNLLVGVTIAVTASLSFADVLFSHQFPTASTASSIWCSSCHGSYQVFDQFKLTDNSYISQIDALLTFFGASSLSSLQYAIFDISRENQLYSRTFALSDLTSISLPGWHHPAYNVSAFFNDLTLASGTYNLSIIGDASFITGWYQSDITVDGKSFQTMGTSGTGHDQAFRIIGNQISAEVPEPATVALFGLGLLGFVTLRRKSEKTKNA